MSIGTSQQEPRRFFFHFNDNATQLFTAELWQNEPLKNALRQQFLMHKR